MDEEVVEGNKKRRTESSTNDIASKIPEVILGTLTFGWSKASVFVDDSAATKIISSYLDAGGKRIDTARCYSDGACEEMLGRCINSVIDNRVVGIDTKVNPAIGQGLTPEGVQAQVPASLAALCVDSVSILYLHQPDTRSDLSATLECVHELVLKGVVQELGLSNFSFQETERCISLCKQHGWTLPTVYQGIYNAVNRWVEEDLFPILRANDIRFFAYSPLAGGLLCKRHDSEHLPLKRVEDNPFYFNEACLAANTRIADVCSAHNIPFLDATYSWLMHHSALQRCDGLVVGASTQQQLKTNLDACSNAKTLPSPIIAAFDACWSACKPTAYPYWRLYSKDMPNGQELRKMAPGALFHCE